MKTERANDRAKDNGKYRGKTFKNVFHEPKVLDPAIIASRREAQVSKTIFERLVLAERLGVKAEVVF